MTNNTPSVAPGGETLKPCPFCGAPAEIGTEDGRDSSSTAIYCSRCGSRGFEFVWLGDQQAAIAKAAERWNRRSPAPANLPSPVGDVVPEFSSDDDGALTIEWYANKASVLTVTIDEPDIWFSAATGVGITSSAAWELSEEPPQSFVDAYRSVVLRQALSSPPAEEAVCARCKGKRTIYVEPSDDIHPNRGYDAPCPSCAPSGQNRDGGK